MPACAVQKQRTSHPAEIPYNTPTRPHGAVKKAPPTLMAMEAQQAKLKMRRRRSSPQETTTAVMKPLSTFRNPETSVATISACERA